MIYLWLCIVWQLLAPWFCAMVAKTPRIARYLGLVINVYIVFAVVVHILPDSFQVIGGWAIVLALIAAVGFWFLEAYYERENREMSYLVLAVAMAGLLLHMAIDGAAIYESTVPNMMHAAHNHSHTHLAWAIVAHQFPVSLFLWLTLRRYLSAYASYFWMIVVGAAAVFGYYQSHLLMGHIQPDMAFAMLQSIAGGALIHCIWHPLHVHDKGCHSHH